MANALTRFLPKRFRNEGTVIPVVRLSGAIMSTGSPLRPSLSIAAVAPLLAKAFAVKKAPAVAIVVNSPGGSPVQSRLIYQRIRDLAAEKGKRVIVFVEDVAASGGYMIACAGDEIVADPSSIVGSIGVVSGSFGFVEALGKLGIERRVHTAGENKATLDPFQPERPEDVEHLKALQREVHETFIDLVKKSRGSRLVDHPDLFTGLFWSGRRGVELGLVDRLGDLRGTLRALYGETARPVLVEARRGWFGRRSPGVFASLGRDPLEAAGAGAAATALAIAEERLAWSRYGL
ncbi:S49 family peptidase [Mangrovicella endophytica]|uniref:S49 family peptidase n=1 Tax=Mangrovicella endophytica TaxID=2066697 RepID=UPI0018E41125|nr:S49 family peptidase [Mangrovicella endophytica]